MDLPLPLPPPPKKLAIVTPLSSPKEVTLPLKRQSPFKRTLKELLLLNLENKPGTLPKKNIWTF